MENTPKKILICEDHQIVIDGLLSIFKNQTDYIVIGYVKNGSDVLPFVNTNTPDVILLDLNLPQKNGLEVLKGLKNNFPEIKVVVLTMYNKESVLKEVIKLNANAFLLKNCSTNELLSALDLVFESKAFYVGKGINNIAPNFVNDNFYQKINITLREKEIISELIKGLNVPQISKKLFISVYTVETHKKNIYKKLNIHNSVDLVTFVNESKLFS